MENNVPNHIAIIMDGNGRWAKKRTFPRLFGHRQGVKRVKDVCNLCMEFSIRYLTLYAFSTENWKRPAEEVNGLMNLFREFLQKEAQNLINKGIRLVVSGRYHEFDDDLVNRIERLKEESKDNNKLVLNVALNYGSRKELVDAARAIVKKGYKAEEIDESIISEHLYEPDVPDPDLIIRTSGEQRLSNFLLWQAAYSELYFTEKFWPEFDRNVLIEALNEYKDRKRKFGGL
ncbi:MAG: isoprenyl transferase [Candidatus Muiribacterium halophilum]|uniref:Isoprenyl transferase n=1 Tax=Muiribacterium halophilum TaxID=2053465 RepID=A0A2N5ZBI4_MUIH1|nr:MAG: isoprenyl transferase [Candidatus Muirbacterium halophilum]